MTIFRWVSFVILGCGLLVTPGFAQDYKTQLLASLLRCEREMRICIRSVSRLVDTDGDGVSDKDETALGTDPNNALSVPPVLRELQEAAAGKLPTFAEGTSFLLFLPTVVPNGKLDAFTSGEFGLALATIANLNYPTRNAFMKDMGLSSSLLSDMGIDPKNGFTAVIGTVIGGGKKSKVPSGLELALSQAGVAQISAGSTTGMGPPSSFPNIGFSNGTATKSGGTQSSFTQHYSDGSRSETSKSDTTTTTTYQNSKGGTEGEATASSMTINNPDGSKTTGVSTNYVSTSESGTTTEVFQGRSTTTDSSGNVVATTSTYRTERTDKNGVVLTNSTHKTETKNEDGSTTTVIVETEEIVDKDNGINKKSEVKTTYTTDSNGNKGNETKVCTGNDCRDKQYVDPDAQENTVTLTPELMKRVIAKLGQNSTPAGTGGVEVEVPKFFFGDPAGTGPLILLDPDGGLVTVLSTPHFFNSSKGTENHGPPGSAPETSVPVGEYGSEGEVFVNAFEAPFP